MNVLTQSFEVVAYDLMEGTYMVVREKWTNEEAVIGFAKCYAEVHKDKAVSVYSGEVEVLEILPTV